MQPIHQSQRYMAFLHDRAGLIVQSTRKHGGVNLRPDHPQFADWVDAIRTAIDGAEADDLCRVLMA